MQMRRRLLSLFVVFLVAGAVALWFALRERSAPTTPQERPFVALEEMVASHRGWELATPPRLPGPYRQSLGGSVSLGGGGSTIGRVHDDSGNVIEDVRLEDNPAFDQVIVYLETESGGHTLMVLRRPRRK